MGVPEPVAAVRAGLLGCGKPARHLKPNIMVLKRKCLRDEAAAATWAREFVWIGGGFRDAIMAA